MKIYKFIENFKYEAKPNYIKLPKSSKMHIESKSDEFGESWFIVLPKDFYHDNWKSIFPKDYDHHMWRQLELGDYIFLSVWGILSDNWDSMSDDDFYGWANEYISQFYVVENSVEHKEYEEIVEMASWGGDLNVRYVEYTDDTKKLVTVHRYETILTPVAISKLITIKKGCIEVLILNWGLGTHNWHIGEDWSMTRKSILIDELMKCPNWQHECSIITDPTLYEEKKKYIMNNII